MFRSDSFRLVLAVMVLSIGGMAFAQESTLSAAPQKNLPTLSNERLGTGVPSRLPKHEVQRPVFTIQSGGPVVLPMPQFRPTREIPPATTPAKEAKTSLPMIEQTRPWQKSGTENPTAVERPLPAARQATANTPPTTVRPTLPQSIGPQPQLTAGRPVELPRVPLTTGPTPQQRPLPRTTTAPAPTTEAPARVLNFSIN